MERIRIPLAGYCKVFVQIGDKYSLIPMEGLHSYGVCGLDVKLYLVDFDNTVWCLVLDGYVDRIKTYGHKSWFVININAFTRREGANSRIVKSDFSYKWVQVL